MKDVGEMQKVVGKRNIKIREGMGSDGCKRGRSEKEGRRERGREGGREVGRERRTKGERER